MKCVYKHFSRFQRGVSLIEVMVALFIMAVGLLGAAAMQLNALKYTDSSRYRTQATFIAYDMLDRIRANAEKRAGYDVTVSCSGVCEQDKNDFNSNIQSTLPSGSNGSITVKNTYVTVAIDWPEERAGGANAPKGSVSFSSHVSVVVE